MKGELKGGQWGEPGSIGVHGRSAVRSVNPHPVQSVRRVPCKLLRHSKNAEVFVNWTCRPRDAVCPSTITTASIRRAIIIVSSSERLASRTVTSLFTSSLLSGDCSAVIHAFAAVCQSACRLIATRRKSGHAACATGSGTAVALCYGLVGKQRRPACRAWSSSSHT